jgi:hypothetical protein
MNIYIYIQSDVFEYRPELEEAQESSTTMRRGASNFTSNLSASEENEDED